MKKIILTILAAVGCIGALSAQNYMVVNSEKIFKSINDYNNAITELDNLAETYQQQVDAKFEAVATLYNNYQAQKANLSTSARDAREQAILDKEQEATKFQESIFGNDGTQMKKRIELIQPIQEKVFKAIADYSKANGFDMVIDIASNATLLYYSTGIDKTEEIIKLIK